MLSLVLPNQTRATRRMQAELGLKQPSVRPDPLALRSLSPTPVRRAGAPKAAVDAPEPPMSFGDHDDRRGDTLPYRTRQEQAAGPNGDAPKPWDRRAAARQDRDARPGDERLAARPHHDVAPRSSSRDSRYADKRPVAKPLYASGPQNTSGPRQNTPRPSQRSVGSKNGGAGKHPYAGPQSATGTPIAGSKPSERRSPAQAGRSAPSVSQPPTSKKSGRSSPSREARRLRRHPELAT